MPTALFDHEKLDVYQLELEFISWLTDLFEELRDRKGARLSETLDQLDRASLSQLLNTAEGNGKRASQLRARFFDDARGSATECAACLDALVAKRACISKRVEQGKAMLVRIVSMLTKLVDRFDDTPGFARAQDSRTSSSRRTRTKWGGDDHG
jgi:four helix bundle protein